MTRIPRLLALLVVLVPTSACFGSASGGGWIPSADGISTDKAPFGFSYQCNTTLQSVTGNLSYQDLGTGHRLVARMDETLDLFGNPISCNTFATDFPGISHACGVVRKGGGGVLPGDLVILGTQDGKAFDGSTNNAAIIALFHLPSPLPLDTPLTIEQCVTAAQSVGPYYANEGTLGAGNITWTVD